MWFLVYVVCSGRMSDATVFVRVLEDLEKFVGWPMFCWRHDRGMVVGILERLEWLYVRRWEQPVFFVLREEILERLKGLLDRLWKGVDNFVRCCYDGRVCEGEYSLGEAMVEWRTRIELDYVMVQRARIGGIRVVAGGE